MFIRIESDGTRKGTRVYHATTGEEIRNVSRIVWELAEGDALSHARVYVGEELVVEAVMPLALTSGVEAEVEEPSEDEPPEAAVGAKRKVK
jgi:hypothetical protein